MSRFKQLIEEVHRRSLWQVLAIYVGASWVVFEVVQTLTEGLGLPQWLPALALVLLLIGLPIVLATAFIQEGISPAGRTDPTLMPGAEVERESAPRQVEGVHRLLTWRNAIAGGVLAMALWGVVATGWLLLAQKPAGPSETRGTDGSGQSVAVLPFDNFSPTPDDAYFANGITEEITSQLSRVSDLRVVSRTAVTRALESELSLAEIGAALNVGAILEGSVRKAGDEVRITAQLIDANTNDHLWSQDFDRELSDIFGIQKEVALAIVDALRAQLTPAEREGLEARPTDNIVAYNLYLRNRQLRGNRPSENRAAIELLRQAVSLDPTFAVAWSRLAWRYVWEARLGDLSAVDSALAIAQSALDMDPNLPHAYYALGSAYTVLERDADAIAQFERALELDPQHESALNDGGFLYARLGELALSLEISSRALPLSPNVPNTRFHVAFPLLLLGNDQRTENWLRLAHSEGMGYHRLDMMWIFLEVLRGRSEAAIDRIISGLTRFAGEPEFEAFAADALLFLGDLETLRPTVERGFRLTPDVAHGALISERTRRTNHAFMLHQLGDRERAARLFDEALRVARAAIEGGSQASYRPKEIAAIHAVRGDTEEALEWLERTYRAGYRESRILAQDPMFASLRDHENFQAILARMDEDVARERARVEAEGIAAPVDSMIAAGRRRSL